MFANYLKIALRNFTRHKAFSFINVVGLAVGLACCLLIFMYVRDEMSFDEFNPNANRIYRITNEHVTEKATTYLAVTPPALGPALKAEFPQIQKTLRLYYLSWGKELVSTTEKHFFEDHVWLAEPTVFEFFGLSLLRGDLATALTEPNSVVITPAIARRYFGDEDPMGRTLKFNNQYDFKVTGILNAPPSHFHLKIDLLGSFASLSAMGVPSERLHNWIWQQFYTYVMLSPGSDIAQLESALPTFVRERINPATRSWGFSYVFHPQRLTRIYLHSSQLQYDFAERGNATYVSAFSFIALIILLLACVNFMNLATAQASKRAREVGLRKVVGAGRAQLMRQFLCESFLTVTIAMIVAIGLVELTLPGLNGLAGKHLALSNEMTPSFLRGILLLGVLVSLVAGAYPALYLSSFHPITILRGTSADRSLSLPIIRKLLVVFQFAATIVLLIIGGVVHSQILYALNTPLGYNRDNVVVLPLHGKDDEQYKSIKTELQRDPDVLSASACYGLPGGTIAGDDIQLPGGKHRWGMNVILADQDYVKTLGMRVIAGRDFSIEHPADETSAFILNETAVRELGWKSPQNAIGREVDWDIWGKNSVKHGTVIGVVKDFHAASLHTAIEPTVIQFFKPAFSSMAIRLRPGNVGPVMNRLETQWKKLFPEWPFEYSFLDSDVEHMYRSEVRLETLLEVFTGLAVFIACLGLFGLTSYAAQQRTREIGVRKVLGATSTQIVGLLSSEFLKLVLIANLFAWPGAYLLSVNWLKDFAYHVDLHVWTFIVAGVVTLAIAQATVSIQAIRAALSNPVEALRYE